MSGSGRVPTQLAYELEERFEANPYQRIRGGYSGTIQGKAVSPVPRFSLAVALLTSCRPVFTPAGCLRALQRHVLHVGV